MEYFLSNKKAATVQITLKSERLRQYFLQKYTQQEMNGVILSLLKN